jgi:endoglucanase Acf2
MKKLLLSFLLAISLAGCAQLGLVAPKSFEQQVAYAEGTVTAVRDSAASALNAKTMKLSDAQQVQMLADQADDLIMASRVASSAGDTSTALAKLQLATAILTQLQSYVQPKGN